MASNDEEETNTCSHYSIYYKQPSTFGFNETEQLLLRNILNKMNFKYLLLK